LLFFLAAAFIAEYALVVGRIVFQKQSKPRAYARLPGSSFPPWPRPSKYVTESRVRFRLSRPGICPVAGEPIAFASRAGRRARNIDHFWIPDPAGRFGVPADVNAAPLPANTRSLGFDPTPAPCAFDSRPGVTCRRAGYSRFRSLNYRLIRKRTSGWSNAKWTRPALEILLRRQGRVPLSVRRLGCALSARITTGIPQVLSRRASSSRADRSRRARRAPAPLFTLQGSAGAENAALLVPTGQGLAPGGSPETVAEPTITVLMPSCPTTPSERLDLLAPGQGHEAGRTGL
jgi:hypothetical protein